MESFELLSSLAQNAFPKDFQNAESVGIQISQDGQRVWVCINGMCVLRIKGIAPGSISIVDNR